MTKMSLKTDCVILEMEDNVGGEKERLGDVPRSEGWLECLWVEKKGQRNRCQEP